MSINLAYWDENPEEWQQRMRELADATGTSAADASRAMEGLIKVMTRIDPDGEAS